MTVNHKPWWKGSRGEWYVVAQIILIAAVFFGPRTLPYFPAWPETIARISFFIGMVLAAAGCTLLLAGLVRLGSNLTPLPYPKQHATLVQTGPYRFVRHPMYAGGIALAYGWALLVGGWLTLVYATILFLFFDVKSNREERWLKSKFPDYADYQRRVRKLIPFVY